VDAIGRILRVDRETAEAVLRIAPETPDEIMDTIVARGSIAVDGVSLTIATVGETWFEVALIPTTMALTTLGRLGEGDRVNLETDCIARMVVNWLRRREGRSAGKE
jgi:riboflavin synthase